MPSLPIQSLPTVVVLASGRGERFAASGGTQHKLRAPLAGVPVLERTLAAVRASGLPWHLEDAGHPGMGDSIAAAVRATSDAAGWLVLPGDLPLVQPGTLRAMAHALAAGDCDVALPVVHGTRGHPVAFAAACGAALAALSGPQGAAAVVQAARRAGRLRDVVLDDVGAITDIDTLDDLNNAEALLARLNPPAA
ncbi:MAG: nucleotidyltransferase family protein [Lysobacteraceae bacterium]|nr:MAG: nucleotidyltransferase family protein [Xanthomonadaceae bacterium]